MRAPSRSNVTLAAALGALALVGYTSLRGVAARPAAAPDDGAARAELARLELRVDALTRALALARSAPSVTSPPAAAAPTATGDADPDADDLEDIVLEEPPRFRSFDAPAGLTITADGGAIAVRNQDPALAGQLLAITALRSDGGREVLTIIVPDPS